MIAPCMRITRRQIVSSLLGGEDTSLLDYCDISPTNRLISAGCLVSNEAEVNWQPR